MNLTGMCPAKPKILVGTLQKRFAAPSPTPSELLFQLEENI